ncbi:MAG: HAD family hydrolase [Terriglobales bacterium]
MSREKAKLNFSPRAAGFIQSVLQLRPQLAVFDCDGTLWAGDAGFGFFDWELSRGLVADDIVRWARARYAEYLAGKVSEDDMCAEMVTINRGLLEADVMRAAEEFFDAKMVSGFFPAMRDLVFRLQENGCEVWAVSSTSEWVIQAGMRHFGIPPGRILAAAVQAEDGKVTDKVIRVPSGKGKPQAIREVIARTPDAVFGNSIWDADMLEIARHPFVINPTAELLALAAERKWPVYQPEPVLGS